MRFPKRNIDISEYQSEIKALLGDIHRYKYYFSIVSSK